MVRPGRIVWGSRGTVGVCVRADRAVWRRVCGVVPAVVLLSLLAVVWLLHRIRVPARVGRVAAAARVHVRPGRVVEVMCRCIANVAGQLELVAGVPAGRLLVAERSRALRSQAAAERLMAHGLVKALCRV